jgi:ankyrin repeat protein
MDYPLSRDMWSAVEKANLNEMERLVEQDEVLLRVKSGINDKTLLMVACEHGHREVARWLLDRGVSINKKDVERRTALWWACDCGHPDLVALLLDRGADPTVSREGMTILMKASHFGWAEIVRMLLNHTAARGTLLHQDKRGRTALWRACWNGRGEVARILLQNGADHTMADNEGTTPMAIARKESIGRSISAGRAACVTELQVRPVLFDSL